jgi:hypothetical protein
MRVPSPSGGESIAAATRDSHFRRSSLLRLARCSHCSPRAALSAMLTAGQQKQPSCGGLFPEVRPEENTWQEGNPLPALRKLTA